MICFGRLDVLSIFIGITVVFSKFIVVPVAFFNFWNYFITFLRFLLSFGLVERNWNHQRTAKFLIVF